MDEIETLKDTLKRENATCVLSDGNEVLVSHERGVRPLVSYIQSGKDFCGWYAADKVVGKAAALLYAHMGVASLYADVIAEAALDVCRRFRIAISYGTLAERIVNRNGDDVCPMEKAVREVSDPAAGYVAVCAKLSALQPRA